MLSKSFKSGKCKTSLKLAASRIKLLKNRREIQVKQLRRELAQLLESGQEQTARIRVEHVIREEKTMSAYELIEIYCELIVARLPIIESQKTCPIDLKEAITSVVFASPRCSDIPELMDARKHFVAKYGKEFVTSALELRPDCGVNRMIVEKLSAKAPDIETKIKILTAIAKEHNVKWDSKAFEKELQKPKEDMLNGPSSFTSANMMHREPLNVNFSPDARQKESASKDFQKDVVSKPTGFNSPHANLRTPNLVVPATQNESKVSETKAGVSDGRDSYPSDETASLNQPTWRMEFKDAASAAQVAAESAERASLAARAAAELASRGNFSRQNSNEPKGSSGESSRNERPNRVVNSNLKGERSESIKMEHGRAKGFQGMKEEVHGLPGDELREVISHSSKTSAEDMEFSSYMDNMKKIDDDQESFPRTEHVGYKKKYDEAGFDNERASMAARAAAEFASRGNFSRQNSNEPKGSSGESTRNERPNRVVNSNLKGEHSESIKMEHGRVKGFQGMKEEVHGLPEDELREEIAHSSKTSAEKDMEFTSNMDNMKKIDDDRESYSRKEHVGYQKKYDEAGFDKENVEVSYDRSASASSFGNFGEDTIWVPLNDKLQSGDHDSLFLSSPAGERIASYVNDQHVSYDYPATVFDDYDPEPYDASGKLLDSFSSKQDDQASSFASSTNIVNSTNIFSDSCCDNHPITVEKVPLTKFDDNRPLAFDESDGFSSESETDNSGSFHNETVQSNSLLHEQRVFGSDSFPREESMPLSSSKTKPIIGTEEKHELEVSSSLGDKDSEMSVELASGGGELGLNFGRLAGGFRNRGYNRPPYTASSVVNSSLPSKDTVGSNISSTEPIASQLDKPLTRTRTADEERYDQDLSWKAYTSSSRMLGVSNPGSRKAKEFVSEEHIQGSRDSKNLTMDKSEEDAAGLSLKQSEYHENNRLYRGGDQNPGKQRDPFESTQAPTDSEFIDQKIYELKSRSKAYKELSSRMSRIDVDSEVGGRENGSRVNMQSKGNVNDNTNIKLSRRTKDFPSKARNNLPRFTGSSEVSNSRTESQSSQGNSAVEPISQTGDEARTFQGKQIHKSLKPTSSAEHPVEPIRVASIHKDKNTPPAQDSDTIPLNIGNSMPSDSAQEPTLREASLKKASHTHPKLPDYDTFAAHFHSLRSNRR